MALGSRTLLVWATAVLYGLCSLAAHSAADYPNLGEIAKSHDDLTTSQRARVIADIYRRVFATPQRRESLVSLDTADLRLFYEAAYEATFYTNDSAYLDDLRRDLDELERRKVATPLEASMMYRSLVALRRFDAARAFRMGHPRIDAEPLPTIARSLRVRQGAQPNVLTVSVDGSMLTLGSARIPAPAGIVVVAHPLCHFTRNAVGAIESDPVLHALFKRHSLWIAPQDGHLELQAFRTWNALHPDEAMAIAYRQSDWPSIDGWDTPTFYFFRNGRVAAKVVGWPAEGHRDALLTAARNIGLLR